MENKKKFIEWIKSHKKLLIFAGISITVLISVALKIKKDESLIELWTDLKAYLKTLSSDHESIVQTDFVKEPYVEKTVITSTHILTEQTINVKQHIRNLAQNCKPSEGKKLEAAKQGIELLSNQTLVNSHTRSIAA